MVGAAVTYSSMSFNCGNYNPPAVPAKRMGVVNTHLWWLHAQVVISRSPRPQGHARPTHVECTPYAINQSIIMSQANKGYNAT